MHAYMDCLQDDLLAQIFKELSLHERARIASVCRRWHRVSTSTHAAMVWRTLCVDEGALGSGASVRCASLMRWCHARGRHIRELKILLAIGNPHDEIEDISSRLLTDLCAVLFASSGQQLQQLSVCPAEECNGEFSLPRPLMGMISIVSSLTYLAVDIPYDHSIPTLAESINNLKHLKVVHMWHMGNSMMTDTAAADSLTRALCRCPMLEELDLRYSYLGHLSAELGAATRLTSLVLVNSGSSQLERINALPCSLQQLRLTDDVDDAPNDDGGRGRMTRDFGALERLQSLQLTACVWAKFPLPLGLTSLRLEAGGHGVYDGDDTIGGISSLVSLEMLCLSGFQQLGDWLAEVAAALRPLHRLRALGLDYCKLQENPAKDVLTRLTLLSLSWNSLKDLQDALPAGSVHNIKVLDISGNAQLQQQNSRTWAAENILAFDSGWGSLQVLGIQRRSPPERGLMATVKLLQRLLQRQADMAEPRRLPATVVYDWRDHHELLRPTRDLAVISE